MANYAYGLFTIALAFISCFIMLYAYLFMIKTTEHKDRRPWDFLFVASILFFVFEISSLLNYLKLLNFVGVDMPFVGKLFEFLYGGLVLLAFISQHDLIMRSHLILISKREKKDGVEVCIQAKYPQPDEEPKRQEPTLAPQHGARRRHREPPAS